MGHNNQDLLRVHAEMCDKARAIIERKNHDYGGGVDAYANFRGSKAFGVSPIKGILLRAQDKMMRIKVYDDTGALLVKDESVQDALLDIINYMVIIAGYVQEAKEKNEEDKPTQSLSLEEAYERLRDKLSLEERLHIRQTVFGWTIKDVFLDSFESGHVTKVLEPPDPDKWEIQSTSFCDVNGIKCPDFM